MADRLRTARALGLLTVAAIILSVGYSINLFSAGTIFGVLALVILFIATISDVRYGLFVLLFLMLFSPEVLVGQASVGGRGVSFRFDDIVIVTIFFAWLARMAFVAEQGTWRKSPLNFLLILYIFLNIFSALNGMFNGTVPVRTAILFTTKKIEYICIFFLVFNSIEKISEVKMFFILSLIICALTCVWGYYMIGTGQITGRFYGPFDYGEANTIAAYFVMHMCLAVALIFHYKKHVLKSLLLFALVLLILLPFALTFSRGGYVGMLAGMVCLSLFKGQKIILVPIIVFLFLMKFVLPPEIFDRIMSISYVFTPSSEVAVQSWDVRLGMWNRAIFRWQKHPLMGSGPGSFDLGGVDNQYVMELASLGIIGFTVFILILAMVIFITIKVMRDTDDSFIKHMCMGFLAGTVGYLVNGFSMSVFILIRTMEPFWFTMGLICFVYRTLQAEKEAAVKPEPVVPCTLPGVSAER